ncbi:MAG: outer membrane lipoprotein-sorting protein [Deltaproteobacteria bacterium]|nr:outer membrane lipoprotein-sorting protein [Deltaproteobacteria bacterium]MCB9478651.1 outer membrane lipoprotein-sorting protein [Deltaproteobacteria bacterium]
MHLRRFRFILALMLYSFPAMGMAYAAEESITADRIIKKADELARGETSYSEITMRVTTKHWDRQMSLKSWTKGTEKAFIVITAPARDAGTTFLKRGNQMWQYLPKIERKIKIPPSMMLQSWMNSDFTNDDLARADSMVTDYEHKIVGSEVIDDNEAWKIESIPHEDAPVYWGKLVSLVQKSDFVLRRTEYYDQDMELTKVLSLDDVKTIDGRHIATHYVMDNKSKPGNKTILDFDKINFDVKVDEDTFSEGNLTRGGR